MDDEKWKKTLDQSLQSITASEELIQKTLRAVREEETGKEKRTARKGGNRRSLRMAFSAAGILALAAASWCFLVFGNQSKNNSAHKMDMGSQTAKEWDAAEPECAEENAAGERADFDNRLEVSRSAGEGSAFVLPDQAEQIRIRKLGAREDKLLTDQEQIEAVAGILAEESVLTEEPRDREAGWKYRIILMSGKETECFWVPEDSPDIQKLDELYDDLLEN